MLLNGIIRSMKKLLFLALIISNLSFAFAGDVTIKDLIYFEEKIQSLLDQNSELAEDPSAESRHKTIHNFTNNFGHQLLNELQTDKPLNGYQLAIVKLSISAYLTISNQYLEKVTALEPKDNKFNGSNRTLSWAILYSQLLQDYKQTYDLFYRSSPLRRVVKDQAQVNNSNIGILKEVTAAIMNKKRVKKLEDVIRDYQLNSKRNKNKRLRERLESTAVYNKVAQDQSLKEFYKIKSFGISFSDGFSATTGRITGGLSAGFGALVGPVEWREGRLHKNNEAREKMLQRLKPLDLILEKKSFKLTDYTIPGHWGHIAVWLGNEKQLRDIGMWNHPIIKPFQEKIKQGYSVYEVRRWGLVWDTLENWMNLDEMAVIRHKQVNDYSKVEYSRVFRELFSQIGKKYDYSFDAMTANTITCTEIISLSYGPVNWPTTKVVGRHTLQPDNIAALTLYSKTPLSLVAYLSGSKSGYEFKSKASFAKLIGFRQMKTDASEYEEKFRKCKRTKYRSNRRGGIRFKNECWSEYKSYDYKDPFDHLGESEL